MKCPNKTEQWYCTRRKNPFTGELNDCLGTDVCSDWPAIKLQLKKDKEIADLKRALKHSRRRADLLIDEVSAACNRCPLSTDDGCLAQENLSSGIFISCSEAVDEWAENKAKEM